MDRRNAIKTIGFLLNGFLLGGDCLGNAPRNRDSGQEPNDRPAARGPDPTSGPQAALPDQAWLLQTNAAGEVLWRREFPGVAGIGSLRPGQDGRIVAAGSWGGLYKTTGKPWAAVFDRDGGLLREHRLQGAGRDLPTALETPEGGLVVIGEEAVQGRTGSFDVYIKKIDPQGLREWTRHFGWEGVESHRQAIAARNGGYLVGGQCWSSGGPPRGWVFRVDAAGARQWSRFFSAKSNQSIPSLALAPDHGVVAVLEFKFPDQGARLLALDETGKDLWSAADRPLRSPWVSSWPQGGIFFSGSFVPAGLPPNSNKSWAAWIEQFDGRGKTVWQRTYQGLRVQALAACPDGGCLLGGWSTYYSASAQPVAHLVKVDPAGLPQWVQSYESSNGSAVLAILPAGDGGYLVGGKSGPGWF